MLYENTNWLRIGSLAFRGNTGELNRVIDMVRMLSVMLKTKNFLNSPEAKSFKK
jgi:hypothetical protein